MALSGPRASARPFIRAFGGPEAAANDIAGKENDACDP
jgi:hypothetical protein